MGQGDALERNKNINPRPSQGVVAIDRIRRKNIGRSRGGATKRGSGCGRRLSDHEGMRLRRDRRPRPSTGYGARREIVVADAVADRVGLYCANAIRPT